ncbi:hypothetical protein SAZ11_50815 [Streptomyces sp. FXJ1.4098]|nr:hypothetical protein [Streptomyces sp. FXJ1.4098]
MKRWIFSSIARRASAISAGGGACCSMTRVARRSSALRATVSPTEGEAEVTISASSDRNGDTREPSSDALRTGDAVTRCRSCLPTPSSCRGSRKIFSRAPAGISRRWGSSAS